MYSPKIVSLLSTLIALPTALANCAYGTHLFPRQANTVPIAKFSYDDLNGPLNWYSLNTTANSMCAKGTHQTPIVLDARTPMASTTGWSLSVNDYPAGAEFENLGSTVEVIVNGTLTLGARVFGLVQYHFHTPSEHRINDEYFPMEVHFVFKSRAGELAVFGIPIELCTTTGCTDQFLAASLSNVGKIATPGTITTTGPLKFGPLIASMQATSFYTYMGSLTTPPCAEGVNWFVSSKTLPIDAATFLKVKKVVKFNARYTQDVPNSINLLQNSAQALGAPAA